MLEDGLAGESRRELDQFLLDLGGQLVQSGGTVIMTTHRAQITEREYVTTHVHVEYDQYSPGLNLEGPPEDEPPAEAPEPEPAEPEPEPAST